MKIVAHREVNFTGHKSSVYALAPGHAKHGFFSSGSDGMIVYWDIEKKDVGQVVAKVDTSVYALHFHRAKNTLIIGQNHEGIHFYDNKQKKITGSIKLTASNIFDIKSIGDDVLVACGDGMLLQVDQRELAVKRKMKLSSSSLRSISINQESDAFAVASSDNCIYLVQGDQVSAFQGHKNSVFKVLFSNDGKQMLSGSRDAQFKFWNYNDGELKMDESIPAHMFTINDIAIRSDQKYVATASKDKTIKIWDFESHRLLKVIDRGRSQGHISSVNKLIWSRYNDFLISASDDRTISVWNLEFNE